MLRRVVNKLLVHQLRIFSVAASTVHDTATKNLGRSKMQTKELADSSAYNVAMMMIMMIMMIHPHNNNNNTKRPPSVRRMIITETQNSLSQEVRSRFC
jgi:hypothetical protein